MGKHFLRWAAPASLLACLAACGSDDTSPAASSGSPAGSGSTAGSTNSTGSTGSSSGSGGGSTSGGTGGSAATEPDPQFIPKATGACPELAQGKITVSPDGKPRDVQIWISDAAKTMDGPVIFYWHGTGSSPVAEPPYGLGQKNIDAILAEGGIVAAPFHDPAAGDFPWFLTTGGNDETDLRVADEVLACAIEKVGVDLRRIHAIGMSAGGLNTTQMSWRRSGYLASVVTYSGGQLGSPPDQDANNKFAAMIFHGGMSDHVVIDFQPISEAYRDKLKAAGHFAFICDHGMGHKIPVAAVDSVHQFFVDHPFGTSPDPYADALPAGFPTYCAL